MRKMGFFWRDLLISTQNCAGYLLNTDGANDMNSKGADEDGGVAVGEPPGGGVLVADGGGDAGQFSRKLAAKRAVCCMDRELSADWFARVL